MVSILYVHMYITCIHYRSYKLILFVFSLDNLPVKFGDDPDLTDRQCHSLLQEFMPLHVTKNKILQQLFIRYKPKVWLITICI